MFDKSKMLPILVAAVICWTYSVHMPSLASAQVAGVPTTTQIPAADDQTSKIVDAANAFLATLSTNQKTAALFAFTDSAQRVRWSNLPVGIFTRLGVRWGELNDAQRTALINLLGTVLSPRGVRMVQEQMAADDVLRITSTGGAGGNAPGRPIFGSDYYFVSFVGTPSTTSPWMLQYGGHHLAVNATVVGPNVTLSPTLTGGQPVRFTLKGKPIYIVENEVDRATELLNGLTETQRRQTVVSTQRIDLVLGPGQDGKTLQPEGLPGSEMTLSQKTQFLALIKARLGILNDDDLAGKMAAVQENLDKTYFAWYGPMAEAGASYFRVNGPTVLLEFSPQALGGDPPNHLHNMYRDPTNEYGAAWTSLK